MLNINVRIWLGCAALVFSATPSSADYSCAFTVRSTETEIMGLDNHRYRVTQYGERYTLSQRYADGTWMPLGSMKRQAALGFTVFTHMPDSDASNVFMLTIHNYGYASLAIHHGWPDASPNSLKAWLLQGKCRDLSKS